MTFPKNREEADVVARALANLKGPNPEAILKKLDSPARRLIDDEARPLDPVRARYLEMAMSPNVVCAKMEGVDECEIAFVGDEPETEKDWFRLSKTGDLGSGGKGYALVKPDGEMDVTHNLWSLQVVPYQHAELFDAKYVGFRPLEWPLEERAYWAPGFDPFADLVQKGRQGVGA